MWQVHWRSTGTQRSPKFWWCFRDRCVDIWSRRTISACWISVWRWRWRSAMLGLIFRWGIGAGGSCLPIWSRCFSLRSAKRRGWHARLRRRGSRSSKESRMRGEWLFKRLRYRYILFVCVWGGGCRTANALEKWVGTFWQSFSITIFEVIIIIRFFFNYLSYNYN